MDRDSVERLRFDRRLQRRSGWLAATDHDAYLEALPDVAEKMTTCANEEKTPSEPSAAAAAPTTPATPELSPVEAQAPAATAGDFSTTRSFGGFGDRSEAPEGSDSN